MPFCAYAASIACCAGTIRVHLKRLCQLLDGGIVLSSEVKLAAEAGIGEQRQWIQFLRLFQFYPGFIEAPHAASGNRRTTVGGSVVSVQLNRAFELGSAPAQSQS